MAICFDANRVGKWVCERGGGTWVDGNSTAIGIEKNGVLVGGVSYDNFNGANIQLHLAGEGNWLNRQFMAIVFDYPFNQLKVNRITVGVCTSKKNVIDLAMHFGFVVEAKLSKATPEGDMLILSMFRENCKYLGEKYAALIRSL